VSARWSKAGQKRSYDVSGRGGAVVGKGEGKEKLKDGHQNRGVNLDGIDDGGDSLRGEHTKDTSDGNS
jgi:hypothetical protein